MATLYTHAAAGLGLGAVFMPRRMPVLFWALAAFLPIVPDFDAFSMAPYGSMQGHRGYTHSLCFALVVGFVAALATFWYFKAPFWPLFGLFFLITASHGILDALTNGGYGIPLFWPFDERRFGPYGPIQVTDIGFEWPDPRASRSVRTELLYVWLPMVLLVGTVMGGRRFLRRRPPGVQGKSTD